MPAEEMQNFRRLHQGFTKALAVTEAKPTLDQLLQLAEWIGRMKQVCDDMLVSERRMFTWETGQAVASLKHVTETWKKSGRA